MSKILKGWELLKEIAEGNIKEGTRFKANYYTFIVKGRYLFKECNTTREYADSYELMLDFEIISDQEEINIQDIKQIDVEDNGIYIKEIKMVMNTLIKSIKQLDNKIKENKE